MTHQIVCGVVFVCSAAAEVERMVVVDETAFWVVEALIDELVVLLVVDVDVLQKASQPAVEDV